jgi:hypothetical protein
LIVALLAAVPLSAECVDSPRKPIEISGALCGTVFDAFSPLERMSGVEIVVFDENHQSYVTATTRADDKGGFRFPPLPRGRYLLSATGFIRSYPVVRLKDDNAGACKQRVFVYLNVAGDCRSFVTAKKVRPE